jgi:hypothetical protein
MRIQGMILCGVILLASAPVIAEPMQQAISRELTPELIERYKKQSLLQQHGLSSKPNKVSPLTALQASVKGTFWRNPEWTKTLDLSSEQQKLIDLTAALEKEELILEPLLGPTKPSPDAEAKILTQIDRIADNRAELEKANSRMLMSILQILSAEQWSKLPLEQKKLYMPAMKKGGNE